MTEASKQRMEENVTHLLAFDGCCTGDCLHHDQESCEKHIYEQGYQAGMQDPDANKKPYNVIYGDEENLYRLYLEMLEIADNRFKKIEEIQAENKKFREALLEIKQGQNELAETYERADMMRIAIKALSSEGSK